MCAIKLMFTWACTPGSRKAFLSFADLGFSYEVGEASQRWPAFPTLSLSLDSAPSDSNSELFKP